MNKKMLSNITYFLKYIWCIDKKYCLTSIPGILLSVFEPFILVIFPKMIIDGILGNKDFSYLIQIVTVMIVCMFVKKILQDTVESMVTKESNRLVFLLYGSIGNKVMSLRQQDVEDPKVLDLSNKIKTTLNANALVNAVANIIAQIMILAGLVVIISRLSFLMVFVIIGIVLINVLCEAKTKKYEYEWQSEASPYQRKFSYILDLMFDFKYGKEIRLNNLNQYITSKYEESTESYGSKLRIVINKFLRLNYIRTVASIAQELVMYLYLLTSAITGRITIGDFTMYIAAISKMTGSLTSIVSSLLEINKQSLFINDFKRFMYMETQDIKGHIALKDAVPDGEYTICFENVSFKYPNSENYALRNINLSLRPGEKLSIVGLNGAGKTTLVKLLTRLYQPTGGRILLNGMDINTIDYDEYISLFSVVFQDYQLFAFSLSENIILNRKNDNRLLQHVLGESGLQEKILSLPNGEKTEIYKIFSEEGIELSGGEAQKVAIARALYKNAPFVILDEPTAALDPMAEYELYCTFNDMVNEKTAIYISHRLSSTQLCDRVAVFINGSVVQYGTHNCLMEENGVYQEMYNKQSGYYKVA